MRIAICDNDTASIQQLEKHIQNYFQHSLLKCPEIACFTDGQSLLSDMQNKDILFLDINMPDNKGIDIGFEMKRQNKNIIIFIVTSFYEYLDDAMRFQIFRYLLKPLNENRLFKNLTEAVHLYNAMTVKIPVETKNQVVTVNSSDIIMVEAKEREVLVYTPKKEYHSIHTMQYWAGLLPKSSFFQTHRSYLVNFLHVSSFDHSLVHLNGHRYTAYLTRRKYTDFKTAYFFYLETAQ